MRRKQRALVLAAVVTTISHRPTVAAADSRNAMAEQLFAEGRNLMNQGDYAQACAKLSASYALDTRAYGTLLNLALCHEAMGKLASAWAEFRTVASVSADTNAARTALATEHANALRPSLSYLTVLVREKERFADLRIMLDGEPLAPGAWDTELVVDPGPHLIEASATGGFKHSERVVIGARADHQSTIVEPPQHPPATGVVVKDERRSLQRTAGLVGVVVGVGSVAAGLGFGVRASTLHADARALCRPDLTCETATARDAANAAHGSAVQSATVATVFVAAGAVLGVGGLVLMLTAPTTTKPPQSAKVRIGPTANGAALSIDGTF